MDSISDGLRQAHEQFVSGHSGSSTIDVILAVIPVVPGAAIASLLTRDNLGIGSFTIEYVLCVIPVLLNLTLLSEMSLQINAVMISAFIAMVMLGKRGFEKKYEVYTRRISFLTSCRASVNLVTAIAILAVDFHVFPRRFAKTEEYGISLMDVGAACFVLMNGITDARRTSSFRSVSRDAIILTLLGLCRLLLVRASNYQHHVTEYGVHANFFLTLAAIKLISSGFIANIPAGIGAMLIVILSACHQFLLSSGVEEWVLSDASREGPLSANREWVVSLPGYVTLYLVGATLGDYIFRIRTSKTISYLIPISLFLFCCLCIFMSLGFQPSRRVANFTFVIWIASFFIFLLGSCQFCEKYLLSSSPPIILEAINRNALPFFLVANVLTGLINKSINTLDVESPYDFVVLNIYLIVLTGGVYFHYARKKGIENISSRKLQHRKLF